MKLNLTAHNTAEERILAYLEQNASDELARKINEGTPITKDGKQLVNRKTLAGFFKYATEEARKLAAKGANFACVDDKTVFGWSFHYFEENAIEGEIFNVDGTPYKKPIPKTVTPASEKEKKAPTPTAKPGTKADEPKKAVILPTPKAPAQKPTFAPESPKKPTKSKPIDTDQISMFDLF